MANDSSTTQPRIHIVMAVAGMGPERVSSEPPAPIDWVTRQLVALTDVLRSAAIEAGVDQRSQKPFRRSADVRLFSLTYRNPIEIVIATGAITTFVYRSLLVLRDWASERRRRGADATLAEIDALEALVDLQRRLMIEGIPVDIIAGLLNSDRGSLARVARALQSVELEE